MMPRRIRERLERIGRRLRLIYGPPYKAAPEEAPNVARPLPPMPDSGPSKAATDDMAKSAQHLSRISRLVTAENDPDRPGSFENEMRRLLGRMH